MKRTSAKTKSSRQKTAVQDRGLYTLEVFLVGGPVTDEFLAKNPVVSRTIKIRADQTLAELHAAIFKAFERDAPHSTELSGDASILSQ